MLALVCEDNPIVLAALTAFLEDRGWVVTAAASAEEVAPMLDGAAPDVAVLDVVLPGDDGLKLLRCMRRSGGPWASVPVLLLTGYDPAAVATGLRPADAPVRVMAKPCEEDALLATIAEMTARALP